jgi:hypothetical protein
MCTDLGSVDTFGTRTPSVPAADSTVVTVLPWTVVFVLVAVCPVALKMLEAVC